MCHIFGIWLGWFSKTLKPLVLLGAVAICWSLWLCSNDLVFEKEKHSSPLQVIFLVIPWLRTWAILQRLDSQDLVVAASQQWHKWLRQSSHEHMGGVLVFKWIVTRVCVIFFSRSWLCASKAEARSSFFKAFVSTLCIALKKIMLPLSKKYVCIYFLYAY